MIRSRCRETSQWLLALGLVAIAGDPAGNKRVAAHAHVEVVADRVRIGEEFVPRFATYLPNVLTVPAGQTVELPADSVYDAIEVAGTLRLSRLHPTTARFTHLMVLPGGRLDAGTADDPVRQPVELIIRDVPLDVARDPFQWGNGLLNFGTQTRVGLRKTPFAELAEDAAAGATTLTLSEVPEGWAVGDELVLPDTRQTGTAQELAPRRDAATIIASIDGATVTLRSPLGFARSSIRDPDGGVVLRPRVMNLTRNIVLRSENPGGTRGHTANVGDGAAWDVEGNAFLHLGRTRNAPPDATNLAGRYTDHQHHGGDAAGSKMLGNVYLGDGRSKWGVVLHQTDNVQIEDNVCVGLAGACFVTEDGNEARNAFRRNAALYVAFTGLNHNQTQVDMDLRCPGCEGSGFWFRGVHQIIEDNESWNNAQGINIVFRVSGASDRRPVTVPPAMTVPVHVRGNITASNRTNGLEYWGMPRFPAHDHITAHNGLHQVVISGPPGNSGYYVNLTAVASEGRSVCVEGSTGYTPTVEVDGGRLLGCQIGASRDGIAIESAVFRNVVMQNITNIHLGGNPYALTLENVTHKPLGAHPKRYIVFGADGQEWQPGQPLPRGSIYRWNYQRGSQHRIINWQGTGKNYQLFLPGQRADAAAWPAYNTTDFFNLVPEAGITMKEAWDKYGMALRGEAVVDAGPPLEGLINGLAREGDVTLPVPRAVMTTPNLLSPPLVEKGGGGVPSVAFYFALTGERGVATDEACFQINSGPAVCTTWARFGDNVKAHVPRSALSDGRQTVVTWRRLANGTRVEGSTLTQYFQMGPAATTSASR
jgi:hypothetical protein